MAQGDLIVFEEAILAKNNGTHDLDTHVFKVMFIDNTTVPTAADVTPVKADYPEVSGGNCVAGGDTLTVSLTESGGTVTYDYTTNISNAKNASNPTNVYYAVCYNDTDAGKAALFFVEIDTTGADGTAGLISLTWGANIWTES